MATHLKNNRGELRTGPGTIDGLPLLSHKLDSIRTYNWEVQFNGTFIENPVITTQPVSEALTLGAKKVQAAGHSVEDIPVRRLNDLYHYPGAANSKELIITFDHLLYGAPVAALYNWFRNGSYNVKTGVVNNASNAKKHSIDVMYYDNRKEVISVTTYYGVFVAAFEPGEHNYSTANDFHTFDVTFRYDFMDYSQVQPVAQPDAKFEPVEYVPNNFA